MVANNYQLLNSDQTHKNVNSHFKKIYYIIRLTFVFRSIIYLCVFDQFKMVAAIATLTFELVVVAMQAFYTLETQQSGDAVTIFHCAEACRTNDLCGGFVWDILLVSCN